MVRMEIACFLVIAFMASIYFSAKREKTKLHRVFSIFLIVSMIHLFFDGVTICTVNLLHEIPLWMNDVAHRAFIGTMLIVFYLVYWYCALLIEDDIEESLNISAFSTVVLVVSLLGILFLPIIYIETPKGNYSYGIVAYILYIAVAIYLLKVFILLCRYWKRIHVKKKTVIGITMTAELFVLIYQAIHPLALISGIGVMLVNMAFYLLMENPDILLVQQIEKEKRKADEANAAKSSFLSHMSHEIRTPMNAIVGMTEILLRTDMSKEQREYLNNIKSSGTALVSIINDILDISKIEAGKMELVEDVYELHSVLSDIYMIIQNRIGEKSIELIYDIDENLPHRLYGDDVRIRQIIINLLNNAVKFTEKGHITLKISAESRSEEELWIKVSVSDTGQGIKEEDIQRLFNAFEQVDTKANKGKEGTGLGLSISSELIRMMGGKLEVRSEYGVGSEFFFTICQKQVSGKFERQEETDLESMNFTAPGARVLVVDDNEMNLKVAVGLLAPLQMQMDVADSGQKALDMIQQKKYHMVFMDHMMPIMDGVEATLRLREMEGDYYRELPVIALTANAMKEAEKLFNEGGMNGFVAKPIDMRQICAVIRKWLPEELLIRQENAAAQAVATMDEELFGQAELPVLEGIDSKEGIKNSGGTELFVNLLGDFYKLIDAKSAKVERCMAENMIRDYTIEVHALKSTSRMIGAMELSEKFLHLEQLGNAGDVEAIRKETPGVLEQYRSYKTILKNYGEKQEGTKRKASTEEIVMYLGEMQDAVEEFDIDAADEAMSRLEECQLPDACQALMESLRVFIVDVAMEGVQKVTEEMIMILEQEA